MELKWYKTRVIKVRSDHRFFNPVKMRIPFQGSCNEKHETLLIVGLIKLKTLRSWGPSFSLPALPQQCQMGKVCRVWIAHLLISSYVPITSGHMPVFFSLTQDNWGIFLLFIISLCFLEKVCEVRLMFLLSLGKWGKQRSRHWSSGLGNLCYFFQNIMLGRLGDSNFEELISL